MVVRTLLLGCLRFSPGSTGVGFIHCGMFGLVGLALACGRVGVIGGVVLVRFRAGGGGE